MYIEYSSGLCEGDDSGCVKGTSRGKRIYNSTIATPSRKTKTKCESPEFGMVLFRNINFDDFRKGKL